MPESPSEESQKNLIDLSKAINPGIIVLCAGLVSNLAISWSSPASHAYDELDVLMRIHQNLDGVDFHFIGDVLEAELIAKDKKRFIPLAEGGL
jgi:hypothetical protein